MRLRPTALQRPRRVGNDPGPSDLRLAETGNVSVLLLAGVGLAVVLCLGVARVGGAARVAARADTAADAAALAGADALALGRSPAAARATADAAARDNGARLVSCTCADGDAEVVVELGRAHGRARAVVDPSGVSRVLPRDP
jgi:secretion/DNA translocation related TadE-like protein